MGYVINMPKLEMGMNQGTLLEWHASVGDRVREDEVLAEIESEKTVAEIPAREDGVLRRVYVEAGEIVSPGTALGILAGPDEDITSLEQKAGHEPTSSGDQSDAGASDATGEEDHTGEPATNQTDDGTRPRATPRARRLAAERDVTLSTVDGRGPGGAVVAADVLAAAATGAEASTATDVRATPKARRRASELGVALDAATGSGPKGAVTAADVEALAGGTTSTAAGVAGSKPVPAASAPEVAPADTQQLSGMRRTIADRLGQSYREAVHVTVHRLVDAEELLRATEVADSYLDVNVSVTDVLLLATSATLREHPSFNARFEDGEIRRYDQQNVGMAVDVERGLVTPVLRDVGEKPLADLVAERRALTEKARSGRATMTDMAGGTFTVSNLGVLGVESFDPVINPPEVAILGVTALRDWPVRDGDGGVTMRRHLGLDLSFDHRVVDGADAARALDTLAHHIRDPWPLLLERT